MKKLLGISLFVLPLSLFTHLCSAQYTNLHNFGNGTDGSYPNGDVIQSGNVLYGMTQTGGAHGIGNVFSIHTNGTGYTDLLDFNTTNGSGPYGSLTLVNGLLYGMTKLGGVHGNGLIFSIDSNGGGFRDLWDFNVSGTTNGSQPNGSLTLVGQKLYGMTENGGVNGYGNIFSIDTNGADYQDRWDFNVSGTTNGNLPYGDLTVNGKKLYGMTYSGGINGYGNIFSIDTNGAGYKDMWDFNVGGTTNGTNPSGDLILSAGKLYGMTRVGGVNGYGNIFSIDTSGAGYKDRWDFNTGGTNGSVPFGSLIIAGNVLFGMTIDGGTSSDGNIFSIDTNGSQYTDLVNFSGANGQDPYYGSLTYYGGTFYGMTASGGTYSGGIVFSDTILKLRTTDTSITCSGDNNGHATAHVTGIATPFTYSWTGGGTTDRVTGLSAGTYTVTVTDNDDITATASITITQPNPLTISIASHSNALCHGSTGSITAMAASGGTAPYTYNWSPSGGTNVTANVTAGTYVITVTDKQGCTATASASITQPTAITASTYMFPDGGSSNGIAAVTPSGGTPPYTYLWSPGGQTTDTIKGQHGPRTFCCTITDNNNCADSNVCITVSYDAGIDNLASNAGQITIYPNPNNGQFTIQSSVNSGQLSVEVYNILGEEVYSQCNIQNPTFNINLSSQPSGIYLYRVLALDGSLIGEGKLIIQK